ncbi:unnamed protein product, partial [Cuscuta epithymum]
MAHPPPPPLGMTPLIGVTLEDLAPGVEVTMAGMAEIHTWVTGALEAVLEAATMAAKVGNRDNAWAEKGGDSSWNSFDLLGETGEEEKEEEEKKKKRR